MRLPQIYHKGFESPLSFIEDRPRLRCTLFGGEGERADKLIDLIHEAF